MRYYTKQAKNKIGLYFAVDWEIISTYGEAHEDYINAVKELYNIDIKCNNCHYICRNNKCGTETVMEISHLDLTQPLGECKKCKGENFGKCRYATFIRSKKINKTINRNTEIYPGLIINGYRVLSVEDSKNKIDHQCYAKVQKLDNNSIINIRFDRLLEK